jgi:hypothetical protein
MVRVQIQLDPSRHRQVKRRARQLGLSVAEVVRRCVDAELDTQASSAREGRVQRALAVLGKYRDPHGSGHVATDHDAALVDAYRR